jgi:hypothetical protein
MSISTIRILLVLISALGVVSLMGCGGGSSQSATTSQKGSVGLLITDKPADPDLFSAINVTFEQAELLGGDGRVELFSGEATYDLLQLRNESEPFSFNDDVPVGSYCKVRLTLAVNGLELVLADDTPETLDDNERYYPKLTGNRKLDLLARDCFVVTPGGSVTLQLDFSAGDSIHIVERGNKLDYNFRPVVFIDVLNQDLTGRLVRLAGEIAWVDPDSQSLLLCNALAKDEDDGRDCALINLGGDSAFFDNLTLGGSPAPLSDLLLPENLGRHATVLGLFQPMTATYPELEIDADALPATGDCRLWQVGLEASQQALPGDCGDLLLHLTLGQVLIDDQGLVIEDYRPLLALSGLAVELGEFLSLDGAALVDADIAGFNMAVNTGQAVVSDNLEVVLQAGDPGVNGTRILSKEGNLLDSGAILQNSQLTVDGVMPTEFDPLQAAVVILDADAESQVRATGTLENLGVNGFDLLPGDGESPCGVAAPALLAVALADSARITSLTITDTENLVVAGGTLAGGQSLLLSGSCSGSDYLADSLVIVDDQSTSP